MKTGTLTIFDALGFRGIWRRFSDPGIILRKLGDLKAQGAAAHDSYKNELQENVHLKGVVFSTEVLFLSDTIVVACAAEIVSGDPQAFDTEWSAVALGAMMISDLLEMAAVTDPPFAYRGCMAFGNFEIENQFIVGPAVDLAAESMDECDGGLVWLLPSAKRIVDARPKRVKMLSQLRKAQVPLKEGRSFRTYAISPLREENAAKHREICDRIGASFEDERLDVQIKKQSTLLFLERHRENLATVAAMQAKKAKKSDAG